MTTLGADFLRRKIGSENGSGSNHVVSRVKGDWIAVGDCD